MRGWGPEIRGPFFKVLEGPYHEDWHIGWICRRDPVLETSMGLRRVVVFCVAALGADVSFDGHHGMNRPPPK